MNPTPLLSLRHATVLRSGKPIIDNLSFDLWEGEHLAILGPNGAGKSTFLKLIDLENHALARTEPSVTVMGRQRWDVAELRRIIGVVGVGEVERTGEIATEVGPFVLAGFFASATLYPHMVVQPSMIQAAEHALTITGASPLWDRKLRTLSTGEMRRVRIARALALKPRALLLDEPTSGLDLVAAARFLDTVREIARSGVTVLLVTHHIEEIVPEIRRVLLLKEGRSFFDGDKEIALTDQLLTELYGAPISVTEGNGRYSAALK